MKEVLSESLFFGGMISLIGYEIGLVLNKKLKMAIANPLLIAIVLVIVILSVGKIDYESYYSGAKYLSYLLTPATICLAIPLYEEFNLLKDNTVAIAGGIISGVLASLTSILVFSVVFSLTHEEYVTMLPKSITTAIGMGVSEELGGDVTITVAAIILTGILGNVFAESVCRLLHIEEPVAKGIAIGTSAHALGTSKALEIGPIEGAMSSLSIVVAGMLTVVGSIIFSLIY